LIGDYSPLRHSITAEALPLSVCHKNVIAVVVCTQRVFAAYHETMFVVHSRYN
jgi:hypothetical protein